MKYILEDGEKLIHFARDNIEHFLTKRKKFDVPKVIKEKFSDKGGAFVTLNTHSIKNGNPLRGCIGYILPVFKNGLRNSIEMIDYGLKSSDDLFQKITIKRLVEIAKNKNIDDLTINVNDSDKQFVDLANKFKLTKNHITEKFLKV